MKNKFLLIAISCTALMFTSCEKEEMGVGGTGGGSGNDANIASLNYDIQTGVYQVFADTIGNHTKVQSTDLTSSNNLNASNKFSN